MSSDGDDDVAELVMALTLPNTARFQGKGGCSERRNL